MPASNTCLLGVILALLIVGGLSCDDENCVTCDSYLDSNGEVVQTCSQCISGFKLNGHVCEKDNGLIIGIAIGAFLAIVAQIVCYIYCKIRFGAVEKKKTDFTLEDIYQAPSDMSAQGQHGEVVSESMKTEFQVYITHKCGVCEQQKTSVKTQCGHYFHHSCFKEEMLKISNLCPKCEKRALSPIKLLCCKCLNKQRSIPMDTITDFRNFHQYICFGCKLKVRKEEQAKKWWKRCCSCC